ncbi:helix-turn-helix domain-containing protein [Zhouia sp. PK063]|uniref:helix-turn-helix domain-containing protein n=1 Tax=Zhouia sp. PK063 TaxID=3373602 RepID=UPI0037AFE01E
MSKKINTKEQCFKYVNITEEEKNWGLYVTGAGNIKVNKYVAYPLVDDPEHHYFHYSLGRRLTDYQILYITKGEGVFESEVSGTTKVVAGDIFILFPHTWHRFKPNENTGWDEYWVEFNGDFVSTLLLPHIIDIKKPVIHVGFLPEVTNLYLKIINLIKAENSGYSYIAAGILLQLIGELISTIKYKSFKGTAIEEKIKLAKLYMHEHITQTMAQEDIAIQLGVSYSLYRKSFKDYVGISPAQFHLQLKIKAAKDLLVSSNQSIKEIAFNLGYQNTSYFYKIFKTKTGYTLLEYRNKNRR